MKTTSFLGVICGKAAPTKAHRPAVWENMLGTVYAMNDAGVVKHFDYDHDAALIYADVQPSRDPRLAKVTKRVSYAKEGDSPRIGKLVLWVKRLS